MLTTENHKWFKEVGIKISFEHVDSWSKSLPFRTHHLWNSKSDLTLLIRPRDNLSRVYHNNIFQKFRLIFSSLFSCHKSKHLSVILKFINLWWLYRHLCTLVHLSVVCNCLKEQAWTYSASKVRAKLFNFVIQTWFVKSV